MNDCWPGRSTSFLRRSGLCSELKSWQGEAECCTVAVGKSACFDVETVVEIDGVKAGPTRSHVALRNLKTERSKSSRRTSCSSDSSTGLGSSSEFELVLVFEKPGRFTLPISDITRIRCKYVHQGKASIESRDSLFFLSAASQNELEKLLQVIDDVNAVKVLADSRLCVACKEKGELKKKKKMKQKRDQQRQQQPTDFDPTSWPDGDFQASKKQKVKVLECIFGKKQLPSLVDSNQEQVYHIRDLLRRREDGSQRMSKPLSDGSFNTCDSGLTESEDEVFHNAMSQEVSPEDTVCWFSPVQTNVAGAHVVKPSSPTRKAVFIDHINRRNSMDVIRGRGESDVVSEQRKGLDRRNSMKSLAEETELFEMYTDEDLRKIGDEAVERFAQRRGVTEVLRKVQEEQRRVEEEKKRRDERRKSEVEEKREAEETEKMYIRKESLKKLLEQERKRKDDWESKREEELGGKKDEAEKKRKAEEEKLRRYLERRAQEEDKLRKEKREEKRKEQEMRKSFLEIRFQEEKKRRKDDEGRRVKELQRREEDRKIQAQKHREEEHKLQEQREEERKLEEQERREEGRKLQEQEQREEERKLQEQKHREAERRLQELKQREEERKLQELKEREEDHRLQEREQREEERRVQELREREEGRRLQELKEREEERRVEELKVREEQRRVQELKEREEQRRGQELKERVEERILLELKRREEERRLQELKEREDERKVEELKKSEEERKLQDQKKREERRLKEQKKIEEERKLQEQKVREEECKRVREIERRLQEQKRSEEDDKQFKEVLRKLQDQIREQIEEKRKLEEESMQETMNFFKQEEDHLKFREQEESRKFQESVKVANRLSHCFRGGRLSADAKMSPQEMRKILEEQLDKLDPRKLDDDMRRWQTEENGRRGKEDSWAMPEKEDQQFSFEEVTKMPKRLHRSRTSGRTKSDENAMKQAPGRADDPKAQSNVSAEVNTAQFQRTYLQDKAVLDQLFTPRENQNPSLGGQRLRAAGEAFKQALKPTETFVKPDRLRQDLLKKAEFERKEELRKAELRKAELERKEELRKSELERKKAEKAAEEERKRLAQEEMKAARQEARRLDKMLKEAQKRARAEERQRQQQKAQEQARHKLANSATSLPRVHQLTYRKYEESWSMIKTSGKKTPLLYADIPWPPHSNPLFVEAGDSLDAQRRKLRIALLRWHPDKFLSLCGHRLSPLDRAGIEARAKTIAQEVIQWKNKLDNTS